jgi:hypothetical protein
MTLNPKLIKGPAATPESAPPRSAAIIEQIPKAQQSQSKEMDHNRIEEQE